MAPKTGIDRQYVLVNVAGRMHYFSHSFLDENDRKKSKLPQAILGKIIYHRVLGVKNVINTDQTTVLRQENVSQRWITTNVALGDKIIALYD